MPLIDEDQGVKFEAIPFDLKKFITLVFFSNHSSDNIPFN